MNNSGDTGRRNFSIAQSIKYTSILFFGFLLFLGTTLEIIMRIKNDNRPYLNKASRDFHLGWKPKENYRAVYKMKSYKEKTKPYEVVYETGQDGFRVFGNIHSTKKMVFFVGDSYVQAVEVSNNKLFYSLLADKLDIEVFAYGYAGYGTLQEKIIIESYIEKIKPDLIVLMTCDNDFIDNYAALELNSNYKVGLRRPYLNLDGNVEYNKLISRRQELIDKSHLLRALRKKWNSLFPGYKGASCQELIAEQSRDYQVFDIAALITERILLQLKTVISETPLLVCSATAYEPQLSVMKDICVRNEIPFLDKLGIQLNVLRNQKNSAFSLDGYHWSALGHEKVCQYLAPYIVQSLENKSKETRK